MAERSRTSELIGEEDLRSTAPSAGQTRTSGDAKGGGEAGDGGICERPQSMSIVRRVGTFHESV